MTWKTQKEFKPGTMSYSTITALSRRAGGGYGLLYEGDNNDIMYTRISLDWLGYLSASLDGDAEIPAGAHNAEVKAKIANFGRYSYKNAAVHVQAPQGWSIPSVTVPEIPAGTETEVTLRVTVPDTAKPGDVNTFPTTVTAAGNTAAGPAFYSAVQATGIPGELKLAVVKVPEHAGPSSPDHGSQKGGNGSPQSSRKAGPQDTRRNPASNVAVRSGRGPRTQSRERYLAATGASFAVPAIAAIVLAAAACVASLVCSVWRRRGAAGS